MGVLLGRLEFLRCGEKEMVGRHLDRPEDWGRVKPADVETWLGRTVRARWSWTELRRRWEGDLRLLDRPGWNWLPRGDPAFPAALAEIADPPWALWIRGQPLDLGRSWVAVVGTRMPDEDARAAAFAAAQGLARDAVVVSGLARGIDGQAHRGALETGVTVAVLGHGIDTVLPTGHRGLARRILGSGGALVSEYGPGEPAFGYRFVERNRLISGLARTVLVIQAPQRSGALATADFALDQGRDVVVHAAGLGGDRGAGTRNLALQGAPVIRTAGEVFAMWRAGTVGLADGQIQFDW
jgi:DNA processing protein